jgi:subtilisin
MAKVDSNSKSLFVVMPSSNVWNIDQPDPAVGFLASASRSLRRPASRNGRGATDLATSSPIVVIDEVAPNDTTLIAMNETQQRELAESQPGLRVVPLVPVRPMWLRRFDLTPPISVAAGRRKTRFAVTVVADDSGDPIAGAEVYAFTDRVAQVGVQNLTDAAGVATLLLPGGLTRLEVVEVLAPDGYWPAYVKRVTVSPQGLVLRCKPIMLAAADVRDHFALRGAPLDGAGVMVGVIDSGVGAHKDLVIAKGMNLIKGEDPSKFGDQLGHGTHVCGIIAGRAAPGTGATGVAPGVTLHVYKIFGRNQETTNSFLITKALRQAVDDGCDLINMSLGAVLDMPDVLREIQRARALGVVCLAATGNDYRAEVGYPARYPQVLAVSAMGRKGTYPAGATQALSEVAPFGKERTNYLADFSNVGTQVAITAPGVGIVSTHKRRYAVMDGTSMACPVATGALARLLARHPKILRMARDQKRSDAIIKLARGTAAPLGFGVRFEGSGFLV